MAPPRRYLDPSAQLVELLRTARVAGIDFEAAWSAAVESRPVILSGGRRRRRDDALVWPSDPRERRAWRGALRATKTAWHAAFLGAPAGAAERHLPALLGAISDDGELHRREVVGDDAEQRRATARAMIRRRSPMKLIVAATDYPERSVARLRADLRDEGVEVAPPVAW